jgi:urease accessory protein
MTTERSTEVTANGDATQRVVIHRRAGKWPEELAVGSFTLDYDDRYRRRICLITDQGDEVLLHLNTATAMRDGDGLQIEDGRWFVVRAAAESVVDVTHRDSSQLVRLAWHLGNRHIPTELRSQALRIRPDHVIEDMLLGLGAILDKSQAAFQPEGGAYSGHQHAHHHGPRDHDEPR